MTAEARFEPSHLIKRDGSVRAFDAARICSAIGRAGHASGEFGEAEARRLTFEAVLPALALASTPQPATPHVEQMRAASKARTLPSRLIRWDGSERASAVMVQPSGH